MDQTVIRALAVTVSNRAAAGVYADKSGPVLVELLRLAGCTSVDGPVVIPDGDPVEAAVTDDGVDITAITRTADRTGVEMEALTAVAVAGLALIDMVKAIDPAAVITDVRVEWKEGGKNGPWHR